MASIAIITDTDSSLPADVAARYNIRQVPINIHFGQETFRTGVDIDDAQLFERIDRTGKIPTPSAPSPGQFAEAYESAFAEGAQEVICFCVSSKASATYSAAVSARQLLAERDITVVDTESVTMGQGFMVLAAAEAAEAGASREEIVAHAVAVRERVHLYAALSTLKYLAMSGRVETLTAGVANLLSVKPILTLRNGTLDMLERVRTRANAWRRVIELVAQAAGQKPVEQMAILHVNALAEARQFEEQLRARVPCPDTIMLAGLTPGLSIYGGTGLVGVALVASSLSEPTPTRGYTTSPTGC
jgi:DegV family protein with EDD domain